MYRAKQKTNSSSATNITTSYINPKPFSPLKDNDSKNDSSEDPDEDDQDIVHLRHDNHVNDENDSENNENSTESLRYNANNANITNNTSKSVNIDKKFVKMTSVSAPLVHSHELNSDVIFKLFFKF